MPKCASPRRASIRSSRGMKVFVVGLSKTYDCFAVFCSVTTLNAQTAIKPENQMSDHNGTLSPKIGGYLSAQPPYAARKSGHQFLIGKL